MSQKQKLDAYLFHYSEAYLLQEGDELTGTPFVWFR